MSHCAVLALENGEFFQGIAIGALGSSEGEVVFNTSMTGYQEILTDPSYAKQIITLTHPHIGNTGVNSEDEESSEIWASGLVIRDLPLLASSWRQEETLQAYLERRNIVAIALKAALIACPNTCIFINKVNLGQCRGIKERGLKL